MDGKYEVAATAVDEMEAKIIESKLRFYDIEVILEHQGAGAFFSVFAGMSKMPVAIYVKREKLEEAKRILEKT